MKEKRIQIAIIFIIVGFVLGFLFRSADYLNIENHSIFSRFKVQKINKEILSNDLEKILFQPEIIYSNDNYKVYSFNQGVNRIDLNFDMVDDYIFVSHINGADYYDYHIRADRDVYNFFINNERSELHLPSYWNIVTKEIPDKKIDQFDRDFVVLELLGCNGGGTLRIIQTSKNETLLVLIDENPNEKDGANTRVRFNIYKLQKSGEIAGSDYIFSFIEEVIGESRGCYIDMLGDKDIISAIEKVL